MQWCVNDLLRSDLEREQEGRSPRHLKPQGVVDRTHGYPQHATVVNRYIGLGGKDGKFWRNNFDRSTAYFHDEDLIAALLLENPWAENGLSGSSLALQRSWR